MSRSAKDQDENSSNENSSPGDPNIVGKDPTAPVQDRRAGSMTPTQEYCSYMEGIDHPHVPRR